MKKKVLSLLMLLFLGACATQIVQTEKSLPEKAPIIKSEGEEDIGDKALWHVLSPADVELVLRHMDNDQEVKVVLDQIFTEVALKKGDWKVTAFIRNGQRYHSMATSRQFIFNMKDTDTYAGSIIIECPRVSEAHFKNLRKMSFFNRYPFSTNQRLCEMVVGNQFKKVKATWQKLGHKKPLKLGF